MDLYLYIVFFVEHGIISLYKGVRPMRTDYNRLWNLLTDHNMKKKDLRVAAHLSPTLMSKLNRNESVTTNTLARICKVLDCRIEDIMEFVE